MDKLTRFIVKKRNLILIIAILLLIPSALGYVRTRVNYDLLSYLPEDAESMVAQTSLDEDFDLASIGMLVVQNMDNKHIVELTDEIEEIDGVKSVVWGGDLIGTTVPEEVLPDDVRNMLYNEDENATLVLVTFDENSASTKTMDAIAQIKKYSEKECYLGGFSAVNEDVKELSETEVILYAICAVILCLIVLFLGLESTIAPLVFMLGIAFPVVYNFGTNIFLGEISYVTQDLALVLQLGVTMDYSIFLLHRYQEEKNKTEDRDEAMAEAIKATFTSITSSSVTTVAGFLALCVMQLTLGKDIGIVMAKGVVLGVLSTIFILPSLLMFFDKWIEKWKHPILIKEPRGIPAFVTKHFKAITLIFIIAFVPMIYAENHTNVYYDIVSNMPQDFDSIIGTNLLKKDFDMTTTHFVLVDDNLQAYQVKDICDQIEDLDGVSNVVSVDSIIGGTIPKAFIPEKITNIVDNGGRKMILVNSDYTAAQDEEVAQLDKIDSIIHEYDENAVIAGEGALTRDLITTTNVDFKTVNILSIIAIFIIILITFKSISLPVILVSCIEFAIAINMGIPYFTGTTLPFIANICIGTIQLGATVDYAILMTTRFREELTNGESTMDAARIACSKSAASIMTSALAFFAACIGVSFIAKMDLIQSLCLLISRGAIISMLCILFILPALLILFNKVIEKTTIKWPKSSK